MTVRQSLLLGAHSLGRQQTLRSFTYNQMGHRGAASVQGLQEPKPGRSGKAARKQENEVEIYRTDRS